MKSVKNLLLLTMAILASIGLQAQKKESEAAVVRFALDEEAGLKVGEPAKFLITVTPKSGWHVYSAIPSDDGAYQPAVLGWEMESTGFSAAETLSEAGSMTSSFDDIMGGTVRYYKENVIFSQEIKLTEVDVNLVGYFDYMACNEFKCIPLTAEFKLSAQAKE